MKINLLISYFANDTLGAEKVTVMCSVFPFFFFLVGGGLEEWFLEVGWLVLVVGWFVCFGWFLFFQCYKAFSDNVTFSHTASARGQNNTTSH